jgi:hypothetical protein
MKEYLDNLKNELKRVDHLIYVSLKYTRTVDVIKNTIGRMISAFDFGFLALLEKVKKRRKTLEIPTQPRKKCELLKEIFPEDKTLLKYIDFYLLLRDLDQAKYAKREEYRRHVTMIATMGGNLFEVNIDILHEYYDKLKEFVEYLEGKLK